MLLVFSWFFFEIFAFFAVKSLLLIVLLDPCQYD